MHDQLLMPTANFSLFPLPFPLLQPPSPPPFSPPPPITHIHLLHTPAHTDACIHTHTHTHTYIHTYTLTQTHAYTHMHAYTYTYAHTHTHTQNKGEAASCNFQYHYFDLLMPSSDEFYFGVHYSSQNIKQLDVVGRVKHFTYFHQSEYDDDF